MKLKDQPSRIVTGLMFRLLPIQILLAVIGSVNGIVSSLAAVNFIGSSAMTAVGLYGPVGMLIGAVSTVLTGGSQILCGKYMGKNLVEKMQNVFSLNMVISAAVSLLFSAFLLVISAFSLSGFLARDPATRPDFNSYALGQAAGVLPMVLTGQFSAFLSLENQNRRVTVSSLICIGAHLAFNALFVIVLRMGVLGLSLASSLSMWAFCIAEAGYFFSEKASLRFTFRGMKWRDSRDIVAIGFPGAAGSGYQTLRGLIVNHLLTVSVGALGVSAFATVSALMASFWSIPAAMLSVSRMLFSCCVGEEDRQTLVDTMRTVLYRFLPLMCAICALMISLAVPLTRLYYRDIADPAFEMTVWGFRILPLCMPFSLICMHFICYAQVSGKQVLVHLLSAVDGVACVAGFSALLVPSLGMQGVCVANVLNGVVTTLIILLYPLIKTKKFARNTEQLMVIPESFGVPDGDRISISLTSMEDVCEAARQIYLFCLDKGIENRRAFTARLCMEEMAGNVISYGFGRDRKKHAVDLRVVYKDGGLILRIKDDCEPFDPAARRKLTGHEDVTKNIGIRMVFEAAESVTYQSVLGLNVLMIKV